MTKVPVHILGLAHVPVDKQSTRCAFTMKVYNLCRMLRALGGYHVTLYGLEGSDATIADEFVPCVSLESWRAVYGQHDTIAYQFDWNQNDACWQEFQRRAAFELVRHFQSCDPDKPELVLCPFGYGHKPSTERLPKNAVVIEPGIGYRASFADFRVFESHALYHLVLGRETPKGVPHGNSYWTVIPNYFDPADFQFCAEKWNYLLYLGRLNNDKGYGIALDAAQHVGVPLLCVGQLPNPPKGEVARGVLGRIAAAGGRYLPSVGPDGRKALLACARAVFVPTQYVEPFGGVHIEAAMSGTPVITSDWGVFPETVLQGVTGYRCTTLREYVWAAEHVQDIRPAACRDWAVQNFSLEAVAPRYREYFRRVYDLHLGRDWKYVPSEHDDSGEILSKVRQYPEMHP